MIELIVVIVIVGILAAVAAPKFTGSSDFETRAAASELIVRLRFAQQLSMNNTQRTTSASISSNQLTIAQDGTTLSGYPFDFASAYSVTLSDASFTFNSSGSTTASTITITPNPAVRVCVENTGFAWQC